MAFSVAKEDGREFFGPLYIADKPEATLNLKTVQCILCDNIFDLTSNLNVFLQHLFEEHAVIIEDIQLIAKLEWYLDYWRRKLREQELSSVVPSIDIEPGKKYFLISTLQRDDRELRHRLRLDHVMQQAEFERSDANFERSCLFCRQVLKGTRRAYLEHAAAQHNLQLGSPQNLVFIDELISLIASKFDASTCIYCEKTFPDRAVLKEHMRKKLHKRINARNAAYDRFFIVNYADTSRGDAAVEDAVEEHRNSDAQYADWTEEDKNTMIVCLFCVHADDDVHQVRLHMQRAHDFDFAQLVADLDFYQRVKLVNYVRKCVHRKQCPRCDRICSDDLPVDEHMKDERCFQLPDIEKFDQPEYYFPTFENDALLYYLEDVDDVNDDVNDFW